MSRVPGTYSLGRSASVCASTGRALVPGEAIVATLCDAPEGDQSGHEFVRVDFNADAWDGGARPERMVCFWRTTAPESDHKRRLLVDDDTLLELFDRLENDERPQRMAYRWLLCLILLRKKLLRHARVERVGEDECWLVRRRGSGEEVPAIRVRNPKIRDEDLQELAEHLGEVMQSEL
ncbi:MAG: hypothetical protein JNK53_01005 [Phycisphaerae bacterium]|nr:hypothetical protein [Phycisphaerae bacterium]